jgi:hypothetical protein
VRHHRRNGSHERNNDARESVFDWKSELMNSAGLSDRHHLG